ncbi:MAG TPA: hypothetical protein VNZ53_20675 [Steroidobacteraceae bacterium]|jgi:hypothetical protein|nr:hypothetical protein [Steroidobacteraceae bacterium]
MSGVKPSATSPTSSNSKPEKVVAASLPKPWQQIWATVKSSTRRWLGLDDEGPQ